MAESTPLVELVLLWHHHQPDYRSPQSGRSLLPWVRLHATKDYLDMALRLEPHPGVRATFNFVPSLLDQLEAAAAGAPDECFELLSCAPGSLGAAERAELVRRAAQAPRWALERWPAYRRLAERLSARPDAAADDDLMSLASWFLLAWLDPMFHAEPAAEAALAALTRGTAAGAHRDALLELHAELLRRVLPAYRSLAERGRIELSESAYFHPILPLLVDVRALARARPELPLPTEPFMAPDDARAQVERAIERHAQVFGTRPTGMWPPEGSVSPEALEILAGAGVRWAATDEAVLWASLPSTQRRREALYQLWRCATGAGDVALLFRDRELSDRVGFVYARWEAEEAVADFMQRVRRIGAEQQARGGEGPAVVTVILDGENCWEHYAEDGAAFLDGLYAALAAATDVRTRTPSDLLAAGEGTPLPGAIHSGSWIDADFHIWCGQAEKNRAWDLLARTRAALMATGKGPLEVRGAWDALHAAEGSDWFWWFGDDHFTTDKVLFDRLFREHLQAVHEKAGIESPDWLSVPISRPAGAQFHAGAPAGFLRPVLDGRSTHFFEWAAAARLGTEAGGGAMHHGRLGETTALYYGFDASRLYLRIDRAAGPAEGEPERLRLDVLLPTPRRFVVERLVPGPLELRLAGEGGAGAPVEGAEGARGHVIELALPFAALDAPPGAEIELVLHLERGTERLESLPPDDVLRVTVPGADFESRMWSV